MKKYTSLFLAAFCAISLVACGSSSDSSDVKVIESDSADTAATSQGADNDSGKSVTGYVFTYNGIDMAVDTDAAPVIDALGEADSYFESPSCAGEGIGKLYTYSDFEIQTYPDGDKDLILYVMLRTDNVATAEGIDLSSGYDDVVAVYGTPSSEANGALTYEKDGMSLKFLFDGDDMISIEYDSAKN